MSRLLETKKKKELKSRGNESHFFLSTQSFPKAKTLSMYQRSSRFTIFSYYTVNYQWCHRWSPSNTIPFCSLLPGCLASNSRTKLANWSFQNVSLSSSSTVLLKMGLVSFYCYYCNWGWLVQFSRKWFWDFFEILLFINLNLWKSFTQILLTLLTATLARTTGG